MNDCWQIVHMAECLQRGWIKHLLSEKECGITVESNSPQAMADAVVLLASDPVIRSRMAVNARAVARDQFDRGKLATQMRNVLQDSTRSMKQDTEIEVDAGPAQEAAAPS